MNVQVLKNAEQLSSEAAKQTAGILNEVILRKGKARVVLSTGASQIGTLKELVKMKVEWDKVEMFHLDEYAGLPESHPASFRKYLTERFVNLVPLKKAYFVNGEGDTKQHMRELSARIREEPVDLGLIGIGENAHIAFNDPPADFDTREAFIQVDLDQDCKKQQVREGWFAAVEDVPKQAITMTVHQIMQCERIISCVPGQFKADAIKQTLENETTAQIPATMLKAHTDWTLYLDEESASLADRKFFTKQ